MCVLVKKPLLFPLFPSIISSHGKLISKRGMDLLLGWSLCFPPEYIACRFREIQEVHPSLKVVFGSGVSLTSVTVILSNSKEDSFPHFHCQTHS